MTSFVGGNSSKMKFGIESDRNEVRVADKAIPCNSSDPSIIAISKDFLRLPQD
jgi:hypothetical protein